MRTLVIALLLAAPLAGCFGDDEGDAVGAASAPETLDAGVVVGDTLDALAALANDPTNATIGAPTWAVGDAWTMSSADATTGTTTTTTMVVTAASGGGSYMLDATNEQIAIWDALMDISYVGKIRASDLAGHQQGTAVKFFDFPLTDGKKWTATWDGLEIQLTATLNKAIPTPKGTQVGFDIVGTHEGATYVTYDYVPALKWWSHLDFPQYATRVDAFTTNWTGDTIRGAATELLRLENAAPVTHTPGGAFTLSEDAGALAFMMTGFSDHMARAIAITDPNGQPVMLPGGDEVAVDPMTRHEWRIDMLPVVPGDWHAAVAMAHDTNAMYWITFTEIGFETITIG